MNASSLPLPAARGLAVAFALASVYVLWGSTYLAIRYALESYPPFLLGTFRNPKEFTAEVGFFDGSSRRMGPMLIGREIA